MKGIEFTGNIGCIRALEDCIRATKKYTEGIATMRKKHPVQGEDFPSKAFCKYYEVYPSLDVEVSWDMPAGVALDWLWREYTCIDVVFKYDYRVNKATVTIKNENGGIKELVHAIPGFGKALKAIRHNEVEPVENQRTA